MLFACVTDGAGRRSLSRRKRVPRVRADSDSKSLDSYATQGQGRGKSFKVGGANWPRGVGSWERESPSAVEMDPRSVSSSRSSRAEVEIWRTFSVCNAKFIRKRPRIAEIACPIRKSGSRNRMVMSEL